MASLQADQPAPCIQATVPWGLGGGRCISSDLEFAPLSIRGLSLATGWPNRPKGRSGLLTIDVPALTGLLAAGSIALQTGLCLLTSVLCSDPFRHRACRPPGSISLLYSLRRRRSCLGLGLLLLEAWEERPSEPGLALGFIRVCGSAAQAGRQESEWPPRQIASGRPRPRPAS